MILSSILDFRTKFRLLLFLQRFRPFRYFKSFNIDREKNQAYIFLAADYGNLGDVAITYAQTIFLENNSNYQVIEIPISKSLEGLWFVKKHIKSGDLVTTVGGGNMGELYDQIEFIRQLVFSFFPNNKIISFPQTFDFSDSEKGKKALNKAQLAYGKHKNLTLVARERVSYELMIKSFPKNKVILTPDIVLSLNKNDLNKKRKGVVFCMRNDKEKSLTLAESQTIRNVVGNHFLKIDDYDTHISRNELTESERIVELSKIWNKFQSAELVVTDRLHGMIFCYITNTPCIVFQNNNHKVRETFKWIESRDNIKLIKSFSEETITKVVTKNSPNGFPDFETHTEYTSLIKEL